MHQHYGDVDRGTVKRKNKRRRKKRSLQVKRNVQID